MNTARIKESWRYKVFFRSGGPDSLLAGYLLAIFVLSIVFSEKLAGLTVFFGVAGAGVAFALQEVIASAAGWVTMSFGRFIRQVTGSNWVVSMATSIMAASFGSPTALSSRNRSTIIHRISPFSGTRSRYRSDTTVIRAGP